MKYLFLWTLLLSSCVQLPSLPPIAASQLNSWHLKGRVAISTGQDTWTATIHWQQQGPAYQLRLNYSFGQGALLIKGNERGVIVHTADKKTFSASDPDTLMAKHLKIEIPVSRLQAWIRGLPAPESSPQWYTLNKVGQLDTLQQDGWKIEYIRYIKVHDIDLPKKIILYHQRLHLQIKIVILQWKTRPLSSSSEKRFLPVRVN